MPQKPIQPMKIEKKELRRAIRQKSLALSQEDISRQSDFVVARLAEIIHSRKPCIVALFAPLKDEVQIAPLLKMVECEVVLPRVEGEQMEFYPYSDATLSEGSFGILEPQQGEPCPASAIDLMVVPGVAFTLEGERMGRGRGFYDRYLSREGFRAFCVGVCYAHQRVASLPAEPHDRRVDMLICGDGV